MQIISKGNVKYLIIGFVVVFLLTMLFTIALLVFWKLTGIKENTLPYYIGVLASFSFSTALGTWTTSRWSSSNSLLIGGFIGFAVFFVSEMMSKSESIFNPDHPLWYTVSEPATFIIFGIIGAYIRGRFNFEVHNH